MTQNNESICTEVSKEFGPIYEQFRAINVTLDKARAADEEFIWHPGVYVFWNSSEVIKVGRHFTNARKRDARVSSLLSSCSIARTSFGPYKVKN